MLCSSYITSLAHAGLLQRSHVLVCNAGSPRAQPLRCTAPSWQTSPHAQWRCTTTAAQKQGSRATQALEKIENPPTTAEEAVTRGLEVFKGGKAGEAATRQALALFEAAMSLQPSRPEARAALYNAGCCHVKLKQWQAAVDAVEEAVNEQGLKLNVAQEDKDLAALRERREWLDAVGRLKGGVSDKTLVQLRSEAKAPLRLSRLIVGSGLLAGAAVGLVIIAARLVQALQGGEGAPELTETLKNLGINGVAVAALGWLVRRDLAASDRDKVLVQREEGLARLQVSVSGDRVLPLASFRGTTRPVLLAGSRSWLQRTMQAAEPYREQLRERGVSLVPLNSQAAEAEDPSERLRALKREFRGDGSATEAKGFGPAKEAKPPKSAPAAPQKDRKWQLEAYDVPEWLEWMSAQLKAASVAEGENVYVQVSLDGTVRSSGVGVPPWDRWLGDLAPLDDIRSRLTKQ